MKKYSAFIGFNKVGSFDSVHEAILCLERHELKGLCMIHDTHRPVGLKLIVDFYKH